MGARTGTSRPPYPARDPPDIDEAALRPQVEPRPQEGDARGAGLVVGGRLGRRRRGAAGGYETRSGVLAILQAVATVSAASKAWRKVQAACAWGEGRRADAGDRHGGVENQDGLAQPHSFEPTTLGVELVFHI